MSNFHPDTGSEGGHLLKLTCSIVLWGREGHCKQILLLCVGSAHCGWTTLGFPQPKVSCTSWVCTAQAPGCSAGDLCHAGLAFCELPRSKLLRFSGALQGHRPRLAVHFVPFAGLGSSGDWVLGEWTVPVGPSVLVISPTADSHFPRCAKTAQSQMCLVSPLGSWSQAVTLLGDVNHPGSQEDVVSNCKPAHSLVGVVASGAEITAVPCLPALIVKCLPLCLRKGEAYMQLACSSSLFAQSFVLSVFQGHWEVLKPLTGKVSCFVVVVVCLLSLWWSHSLDC